MANHSFSRRRFLAGTGLLLAGTTLKLHSTNLVDESLDAGDPIIDIHQHTDYTGRTNNQLIAHQRTLGIATTMLLPAGSQGVSVSPHQGFSNGFNAGLTVQSVGYKDVKE